MKSAQSLKSDPTKYSGNYPYHLLREILNCIPPKAEDHQNKKSQILTHPLIRSREKGRILQNAFYNIEEHMWPIVWALIERQCEQLKQPQ